jgi:Toprim-like
MDAQKLLRRFGIRVEGVDQWRFGDAKSANDVSRVLAEPTTDLWMSRFRTSDKKLILVERPIDALSYEQANGDRTACYMAVGSLLPRLRQMVGHVLRMLPPGVTVVLAFSDDEKGQRLTDQIRALARGLPMVRHCPEAGVGWNDHVRSQGCGRLAYTA